MKNMRYNWLRFSSFKVSVTKSNIKQNDLKKKMLQWLVSLQEYVKVQLESASSLESVPESLSNLFINIFSEQSSVGWVFIDQLEMFLQNYCYKFVLLFYWLITLITVIDCREATREQCYFYLHLVSNIDHSGVFFLCIITGTIN